MFVLGGLTALVGMCAAGIILAVPMDQLARQPGFLLPEGMTLEMYRTGMIAGGVILVLAGGLGVVLGMFVRRGSRGAIIASLILAFLGIAWVVVNMISSFAMGLGGPVAAAACFALVALALQGWQVAWLFQAKAAADRVRAWSSQYGGQYQQYQQYQQPYGQQQPPGYPPSQQPQSWQQPGWPPPPPPQQPPPSQQNWPPPSNQG
jgi:hypothetical protein